MAQNEVTVYGADWCEDTQRSMSRLDDLGVGYTYVNIDHDADAKRMITDWNNGRTQTPAVVFGAGERPRLIEPSDEELDAALRERGLLHARQGS